MDPEVAELRKKLKGVKWMDLCGGTVLCREGTNFVGRFGSFLNKYVVMVIAADKIVAITPVAYYNGTAPSSNRWLLDLANKTSGQDIISAADFLARDGIHYVVPMEEFDGT